MAAMPVRIEGYVDCSSPNAYTGYHHLERVVASLGLTVEWKPILVGGVFNTVNQQLYATRAAMGELPARKLDYLAKDRRDWDEFLGIVTNFPPKCGHPVNSARCMRACLVAEPMGLLHPFLRAGFEALWVHGLDLATDETLVWICERAGADPVDILDAIAAPEIKAALRRNTDELIARGGFGTPTFFVGGDDMYFGNDRVVLVEAALRRQLGA